MPLLDIQVSKKITATVTLEESTALFIDRYAVFTQSSADDVVDKALQFVFAKDKEFQQFCDDHKAEKPAKPLRIKSSNDRELKGRRGRKPTAVLAS